MFIVNQLVLKFGYEKNYLEQKGHQIQAQALLKVMIKMYFAVPRQEDQSDIGSLVSVSTISLILRAVAQEVKSSIQVACIESQSIMVEDKTVIILCLFL